MTNWHESPLMIVKSADPTVHEGASLKKMLNEIEALFLANGYTFLLRLCICAQDTTTTD
ncbi:MAG: hypothetical protein ACJ71I_10750 [Nitrososphaeraceae archaeon]|jgi:hypothetical protein